MITAEKQKGHVYYRCTKKGKQKCSQLYVREEELNRQLSFLIQKVSLRTDWADKLLKMAEKDKEKSTQSVSAFAQEVNEKIKNTSIKLQRLLDGYLEQDIEREVYREKKAKLLSEKKSLEGHILKLEQKQQCWLEPFQNWIKIASNLVKTARDDDLFEKKVMAKEIFGSNLRLAAREARGNPLPPYFAALRAAESVGKKSESLILVPLVGIEPTSTA